MTDARLENLEDNNKDANDIVFAIPVLPPLCKKETEEVPTQKIKDESISTQKIKDDTQAESRLPYTPPEWESIPPEHSNQFFIELIKNGTIINTIYLSNLKNKTYLSFGRFPPSEVQLDHPSVSRYHCIIQYGKLTPKPSWYLYDLDSTHGTRLNKQTLKKRSYIPLKPGYVFQFAGSSLIFSFCGPEEEEKILQTSFTHNKLNNVDEDLSEDDGVKYYAKDPIGWLDKYFEREGIPMLFEYANVERGAEWSCSIELPDVADGGLVAANGITRKLAQFQCAMEACHKLDLAGLLRNVSLWNKRATYAENDYYDSDEDTFYDRTGQLEAQRIKRRKRCEGDTKNQESTSKTHDDLIKSLTEAEEKLKNAKTEIERLIGKNFYTDADGNVISTATNFSSKMAISQMRLKEKRLNEECEQLKKLIIITQPRSLDSLFAPKNPSVTKSNEIQNNSPKQIVIPKSTVPFVPETEDDDDDDTTGTSSTLVELKDDALLSVSKIAVNPNLSNNKNEAKTNNDKLASNKANENVKRPERIYQPAMLPSNFKQKNEIILPKYGLLTKEEARIKKPIIIKRNQQILNDELEDETKVNNQEYKMDENYITWLPPSDQTGDGKTKLNEKFGGRY